MPNQNTARRPFTRRKKAFVLMLAVIAALAILLYLEQIAVIYVLATLVLVAFLIVVAKTDLEKVGMDATSAESPDSEN
jgi:uncharacterized membrane protein YhaH (DUF805 family)